MEKQLILYVWEFKILAATKPTVSNQILYYRRSRQNRVNVANSRCHGDFYAKKYSMAFPWNLNVLKRMHRRKKK